MFYVHMLVKWQKELEIYFCLVWIWGYRCQRGWICTPNCGDRLPHHTHGRNGHHISLFTFCDLYRFEGVPNVVNFLGITSSWEACKFNIQFWHVKVASTTGLNFLNLCIVWTVETCPRLVLSSSIRPKLLSVWYRIWMLDFVIFWNEHCTGIGAQSWCNGCELSWQPWCLIVMVCLDFFWCVSCL